jgi:dethiobiotin synthetase
MRGGVLVIGGIDTGVGKTIATGLLARALIERGRSAITQKIVQTGCTGFPDDIMTHRMLMGVGLQDADREGKTCPYVFPYPASPHLAARMEGITIDIMDIRRATFALQKQYSMVLLEGTGGLLVPLSQDLLVADYIRDAGYPLLLVSSSRLGSINHTLLSLEACVRRGIAVKGLLYNRFREGDTAIGDDSRHMIDRYLKKYGLSAPVIDLHEGVLPPGTLDILCI